MTYSDNGTERLELLQQHRQENNEFWIQEWTAQRALICQHQQEMDEQRTSKTNAMTQVNTIRRHTSESMELGASRDERKWRLDNQHQRELDDLTIRQNIKNQLPQKKANLIN